MATRFTLVAIIFLFVLCFLAASVIGHSHDHVDHGGHGHSHDDLGGHHGHSHDDHGGHDHFGGHGHSHDGHGHSHDDHDHFHDDDHLHQQPAHFKYSREANEPEPPSAVPPKRSEAKQADTRKPQTQKPPASSQQDLYDRNSFLSFMNNPTYRIWVYSIGSTLLISAAPFFILFFIPIGDNKSPQNSPFLKVLLSFASGGLLGDALLHLIPHSLNAKHSNVNEEDNHHHHDHSHSHGHGHSHGPGHQHDMNVGLYVLLGITTFLIIEKLVRIVKGDGHGHSHGERAVVPVTSESKSSSAAKRPGESLRLLKQRKSDQDTSEDERSPKQKDSHEEEDTTDGKGRVDRSSAAIGGMELRQRKRKSSGSISVPSGSKKDEDKSGDPQIIGSRGHSPNRKRGGSADKEDHSGGISEAATAAAAPADIKVAGYLNLAADFAHNFTDGLAVGASYIAGTPVGVVTTLTVLVHEIPHEIGDFAILVQSGCSKRNAIFLQLLTACGAILGCCISLCTSDPDAITQAAESSWVLPFTAGGFIYVATVSVIPELLENSGLWQSIKEITALFVGIGMMVLIAKFE